MKKLIPAFILFLCLISISLSENVRAAGLDFEYEKISNNEFDIKIFRNVKLRLQGSINNGIPDLKGSADNNAINKIPGLKNLKKIGIQIDEIFADSTGLGFKGKILFKGVIQPLAKFLNLSGGISITGLIRQSGITLLIPLFQQKIKIPVVPFLGTEIRIDSLNMKIYSALGSSLLPAIGLQGNGAIKPTRFDKFLKCIISAEFKMPAFTFALSIDDTWKNPLGVPFGEATDSAIQVTLSPPTGVSGIGFTVRKANILGQQFSLLISADMGRNSYALIAEARKIGASHIAAILNKIHLPIPLQLFPSFANVNNFAIHFAPTGGTVGVYEFKSGYLVKGDLRLKKMDFQFEGNIDSKKLRGGFLARLKNLDFIQKLIVNAVKKISVLKPVVNTVANTLRLSEVSVGTNIGSANSVKLNVKGKVLTFPINLNIRLSSKPFDAKTIINRVVKLIQKNMANQIADAAKTAVRSIQKAGSFAISKTKKSVSGVLKFASNIASAPINAIRKLTEKYGKNAKKMRNWSNKVFAQAGNETMAIISEFLNTSRAQMSNVLNQEVADSFKQEWEKLMSDIRMKWKAIYNDRTCRKFFKKKSNKNKGQREYQQRVIDHWKTISNQILSQYLSTVNGLDANSTAPLRPSQDISNAWFKI